MLISRLCLTPALYGRYLKYLISFSPLVIPFTVTDLVGAFILTWLLEKSLQFLTQVGDTDTYAQIVLLQVLTRTREVWF